MLEPPDAAAVAEALRDPATWLGLSWQREALLLRFGALAFWTLAALTAGLSAPRSVARGASLLRRSVARPVVAGLLLHASLGLGFVLAAALTGVVVGVPLLALLGLVGVAIRATGLASAFVALGRRVVPWGRGASAYAHLMAGALIAGLTLFVPVVGPIAWMLVASAGCGAVLASRAWRRGAG